MEKKARKFSHLTETNRYKIEQMITEGYSTRQIAAALHVHVSTINREKKRGMCIQKDTHLREREVYCADVAQRKYEENLKAKGPGLKIANNRQLANYLENLIVDKKYSPDAALALAKEEGVTGDTSICRVTLYSYIEKGVFLRLTNKDLPVKGMRKRRYHKVERMARAPRGDSIEQRPEDVMTREDFGHWEMDSVLPGGDRTKKRLLVLTERKTRHEIIMLLENGKTESVVAALDQLEESCGAARFREIFRTITVDNGSEFADYKGIQHSCIENGDRTHLFYCHPYSSFERGGNENGNKLIRRWLPKGMDFTGLTDCQVKRIEDWMNNYPRRRLGYNCSRRLCLNELHALGIEATEVARFF